DSGAIEVVRLDTGCHSARYDERVVRLQSISLAVRRLRFLEFMARGVHIAQCKVRHIERGIIFGQLPKIFDSLVIAASRAGSIAERSERETVTWIDVQNFFIDRDCVI